MGILTCNLKAMLETLNYTDITLGYDLNGHERWVSAKSLDETPFGEDTLEIVLFYFAPETRKDVLFALPLQ